MLTIIGLLAGFLTTISFLPQVIKTWKTRSTEDLSLSMFSLFTMGVLMWLLYGIGLREIPIIVANLVTLVLAFTLLVMKIVYK
ncbi:SemiSWEET transporter [Chitinispirillales bacterium ANBcel5]|uniref:SemiSWEET transporter n=1 Tax=Cellulosispirillum alkaliphilum TaxID=3039283 RepID=UPI002A571E61|nr:SemiSWEET transporter [Chitinispirillales bacterium ANBcel5]